MRREVSEAPKTPSTTGEDWVQRLVQELQTQKVPRRWPQLSRSWKRENRGERERHQ